MKTGIMPDLLSIANLSVEYNVGNRGILALNDVDVRVPSSSYTLGIVGESGSGKTTLGMSILNAIEPPGRIRAGEIDWMGENVLAMKKEELRKYRWKEVAMVYQSAMNSLNPVKRVYDHIAEVIMAHTSVRKGEARRRAVQLLSDVGISPDRAKSYSHEFSGGMRQRVAIALALALDPKLLIADEPTSALDVVVQRQIIDLLKTKIQERHLSLVFITHEISLLPGLVDNIIVMYSGQVVESGPTRKVLSNPKHPYTEMLVGSILSGEENLLAYKRRSLDEISAHGNSLNECSYANRCKYVFERCRNESPRLMPIDDDRLASCHKYA